VSWPSSGRGVSWPSSGRELPPGDDPHNSGPIQWAQWARGDSGADAPPLAAPPSAVPLSSYLLPPVLCTSRGVVVASRHLFGFTAPSRKLTQNPTTPPGRSACRRSPAVATLGLCCPPLVACTARCCGLNGGPAIWMFPRPWKFPRFPRPQRRGILETRPTIYGCLLSWWRQAHDT